MSEEISVTLTGFKTPAQAQAFVDWYNHQGEQAIPVWLECRDNLDGVTYMDIDNKNVVHEANGSIKAPLKLS